MTQRHWASVVIEREVRRGVLPEAFHPRNNPRSRKLRDPRLIAEAEQRTQIEKALKRSKHRFQREIAVELGVKVSQVSYVSRTMRTKEQR